MKKKNFPTKQDKEDWISFTKEMGGITSKDDDFPEKINALNNTKKLDLHGMSLEEANKKVEKFIIDSFGQGYRKLLIVTGKGLRSKNYDNPYVSSKLSVLKYSVPEYIKHNENLNTMISKTSIAEQKDGGDGAIYIYLKKNEITK